MASSIEIDVSANIAKFKAGMDKAAREGQELNRKLDRAFGSIRKSMQSLGALAGVAVGGSFLMMGKKSIDAADKIQKLSQRLGASSEALSEYRHVAELSGVSFETLTMGWQRMTRRVAEAAAGTGEAKNALKELGVNAQALNQLAPEKQFEVLADAIQGVKNPADQVRLAMKLFDSEGVSLIQTMQGGSEGIRQMRDEAVSLGKSLSEDQVNGAAAANDALTRLSNSISGSFSQAILQYSDEIKQAADFTREYLPRSIEFLMDIFRGLTVVFNSVVLVIQKGIGKLLDLASSLPVVGDEAEALSKSFNNAAKETAEGIEDTIGEMGKWRKEGDKVNKELSDLEKGFTGVERPIRELNPALFTSTQSLEDMKDEAKRTKEVIKELEQAGKDFAANIPDKMGSGAQRVTDALAEVRKEALRNVEDLAALNEAIENGSIESLEQLEEVAGKLGLSLEDLGVKTEEQTGIMGDAWKQFADYAYDSMKGFWDGLITGTKSTSQSVSDFFEDMISNILTQITNLLASNIWKKFVGWVTGNGSGGSIWAGVADAFLGTGGGSNGNQSLTSLVTGSTTKYITQSLTGSPSTASGFGMEGASLVGGGASSAAVSASLSQAAAGLQVSSAQLAVATQGVNSAVASGSALASGGGPAYLNTGVSIGGGGGGGAATGAGVSAGTSAALAAAGWFAAAVAVDQIFFDGRAGDAGAPVWDNRKDNFGATPAKVAYMELFENPRMFLGNLFGMGARSPMELGLDQLAAVDEATKAGRNQNVELGAVGNSMLSFIGGHDENSLFFGIDKAKDELQEVGNILVDVFGYKQGLALKDGIIRLEDFTREFSKNQDVMTNEVRAAILIQENAFKKGQLEQIGAMGDTVIAMDRLFDQNVAKGMETADALLSAYQHAFKVSEDEATLALQNIGLSSEEMAAVFSASSDDVLATMLGVQVEAMNTGEVIETTFSQAAAAAQNSWNNVQLSPKVATVVVQQQSNGTVTTQQAPASGGRDSELANEVRNLVNEMQFNRAANA